MARAAKAFRQSRIERHPIKDIKPGVWRDVRDVYEFFVRSATQLDYVLQVFRTEITLLSAEHKVSLSGYPYQLQLRLRSESFFSKRFAGVACRQEKVSRLTAIVTGTD